MRYLEKKKLKKWYLKKFSVFIITEN